MKTIDELGISPAPWKCEAGGIPIDANNDYLDPTEAEARLIAAAPDCYKALFNIVDSYNRCEPMDVLPKLIERAEEALAKASGEDIE